MRVWILLGVIGVLVGCTEPPSEPPSPPAAPITYAEWLALNPAERQRVRATWNPYQGENIHIAEEALLRLCRTGSVRIVGGFVGTFHGGEYILNPMVAEADLQNAPAWMTTEFDGFRIGYTHYEPRMDNLRNCTSDAPTP